MKYNNAKWLMAAGLLLAACSQDDNVADNGTSEEKGVVATVEPFKTADPTRTTLTLDETTGLNFSWNSSDYVGVYGKNSDSGISSQTAWSVTPKEDVTQATFTSENFSLLTNNTYVAYLPYSGSYPSTDGVIPVSYDNQTVAGDGSTSEIGNYDYLVSDAKTPETATTTHFTFNHMGAAVRFRIGLKKLDGSLYTYNTWSDFKNGFLEEYEKNQDEEDAYAYKCDITDNFYIELTEDGNAITTEANLNLFGENYGQNALDVTKSSNKINFSFSSDDFSNQISTGGEYLYLWVMLPPTDKEMKFKIYPTPTETINNNRLDWFNSYCNWEPGWGEFGVSLKSYMEEGTLPILKAGHAYNVDLTVCYYYDSW